MTDSLAPVFLSWMLLQTAGLTSQLLIVNAFFERKHSYLVWLLYFGCRAVLRSFFSTYIMAGSVTPAMMTVNVILVIVTAATNFLVLFYTWDADPLKLAILAVMADLVAGSAMGATVCGVNSMRGRGMSLSMLSPNLPDVLLIGILTVLIVMALIWLFEPAIKWYRVKEFEHRKTLTAMVILAIALFSTTNLTGLNEINYSVVILFLVALLLLLPFTVYFIKNLQLETNRKRLLKQQAEMTSAYILAVDKQSELLDANNEILDEVSKKIAESDQNLKQESLRKYLLQLKGYAESLKNGKFTNNLALDAVLASYANKFEQSGCSFITKADTIDENDKKAAEITWILLNWVEHLNDSTPDVGQKRKLKYYINGQGNQLIFKLVMEGMKPYRFPKILLENHIGKNDIITESFWEEKHEIDIMTEIVKVKEADI